MLSTKLEILLYIVINLLSLYTFNSVINIFINPNKLIKMRMKVISYIVYFGAGLFTYFSNSVPYVNIVIQVMLAIIILNNFIGSSKMKLTIAFSWTTFKIVTEIVVSAVYGIVMNISLNNVAFNDVSSMIASTICALIPLVITKILYLFKTKKQFSETISFMDSLQVSIIPICSIIIMCSFIEISFKYPINNWLVVTSLILIVFINMFFFFLFERLKRTEKIKYENELFKKQSEYYVEIQKNINSTFDKIRMIKHDLKHQLLYIKVKAKDDTGQSLNYVSNQIDMLIGEVLADNIKEYTKNEKLNRLLNYKLFLLHKSNLDLDVKINIKQDTYIDESDLYTILGNAIDNATENFNSEESEQKKIIIRIFDDNDNLFIRITNPYIGKIILKNELPVTKKHNKSMHGIGLASIKKLVEEKNGHLKITTDNNIFSLEVLLYDEIKSTK